MSLSNDSKTLKSVMGTTSHDSPRPWVTVEVPQSFNISAYEKILGEVTRVNIVQLVMFGGLCGLAYAELCGSEFNTTSNLQSKMKELDDDDRPTHPAVHRAFIRQVCDGVEHPKMKWYRRFTYLSRGTGLEGGLSPTQGDSIISGVEGGLHCVQKDSIIWPLCYIVSFLNLADRPELKGFLQKMVSESARIEHKTGLEWQAIVLAAVAIRIHSATLDGQMLEAVKDVVGPIQMGMIFRMIQLPVEVSEVEDAVKFIKRRCLKDPTVFLAYASNGSFKCFDGIIIHYDGNSITECRGLQAKQGAAAAGQNTPPGWKGFLFRGKAPVNAGTLEVTDWVYLAKSMVIAFMPVSLRGLVPEFWPSGQSLLPGV
jgi:hypothetical protein